MISQVSYLPAEKPGAHSARRKRREMSFEAQVLWQSLRGSRFMDLHFRRTHRVEGYILDFYCYSKKLAIELRGSVVEEDGEFDSYKDLSLAASGVRLIRFTNSEVRYQLPKVLQRIRDACSV
jgi:very-short-patch-repair endonuclease